MQNGGQDQSNFSNINFNEEMTVNGFLEAISEVEYPQYLLDAVSAVQDWLRNFVAVIEDDDDDDEIDAIEGEASELGADESGAKVNVNKDKYNDGEYESGEDDNDDEYPDDPVEILKKMFESEDIDEIDIEESLTELFEKIDGIDDKVDVIPNTHKPDGNRDAMIISVLAQDCEGGLRTAIDYAAVFNRKKCKRVWIISDTFIFDEAAHFAGHIDALEKQGISMRFILVNPWGWVELPLSRASAAKKQFMWHGASSRCDNKSGDKLNGD